MKILLVGVVILSVLMIAIVASVVEAEDDKAGRVTNKNVDGLLSDDRSQRDSAVEALHLEYFDMSGKLLKVLQAAAARHKEDNKYHSPLHCAILACGSWRVAEAEKVLIDVVDYTLDARSLPVGLDVSGEYFYPAANVLVKLRTDPLTVAKAIGNTRNSRQVRLLTWVLLRRTGDKDTARFILERAKGLAAMNKESLNEATKLLDVDSDILPPLGE